MTPFMLRLGMKQTIVLRLVLALLVGGMALSAGLSLIEIRRTTQTMRQEAIRDMGFIARCLQVAARQLPESNDLATFQAMAQTYHTDERLGAVRLMEGDRILAMTGDWTGLDDMEPPVPVWTLAEQMALTGRELSETSPLSVWRIPFNVHGRVLVLEMGIDMSDLTGQLYDRVYATLGTQWLVLSVLILVGLLLLRLWVTGPLSEVSEMIGSGAGAEAFYDLSRQRAGEYAQLSEAIGGMLTRIDATSQRLRQRERAFDDLFQFAPVAMVSLDGSGRIIEANHRAIELLASGTHHPHLPLGLSESNESEYVSVETATTPHSTSGICSLPPTVGSPQASGMPEMGAAGNLGGNVGGGVGNLGGSLGGGGIGGIGGVTGKMVLDYIRQEDRLLLRQTIDRLDMDTCPRCELRLAKTGRNVDVLVECTGLRDEDGNLLRVRLSMLDVTEPKLLHKQLADKSRLLNLVIDHMSDAILLVDQDGRVAAHNRKLAALLGRPNDDLTDKHYDPSSFWDDLNVQAPDTFVARIKQIEADHSRPAQERFEAQTGTFQFEGIPIQDERSNPIGRLWVVQEITHEMQIQKLLGQQSSQLQALKRLSQQLCDITGLDDLMTRAGENLYAIFGVEAMGVVIASDAPSDRHLQVLHRGISPVLLSVNQPLVRSIEKELLPQVTVGSDVMFWSELPMNQPWAKTFSAAGLTSVAAAPLRDANQSRGMIWIARRGDERIDRHLIYLLEALAPVLGPRVQFALQREHLQKMQLTDLVTNLPNAQSFHAAMRRCINRPGYAWAMAMVKVDHFNRCNQAMDHASADQLLRRVANELNRAVARSVPAVSGPCVARLSGATFGVLMPGVAMGVATDLAHQLQQVVKSQQVIRSDGQTMSLTASIGLAHFPADNVTADELFELVRTRLDSARHQGGDRLVTEGHWTRRVAG